MEEGRWGNTMAGLSGQGLRMERCLLNKEEVLLPEAFVDQTNIFQHVMSQETWDSVLTEEQRKHLEKFLPSFPKDVDAEEKNKTIRRLFLGENFKFGNPLMQFHQKVKDGYLSPDIAKYSRLCRKFKYREYKFSQQQFFSELLKEILISRQCALGQINGLPPDQPLKFHHSPQKDHHKGIDYRVNKNYLRILKEAREECGLEDTSSEEEDSISPVQRSRRQLFKSLGPIPSPEPTTPSVVATFASKPSTLNGDLSGTNNSKRPRPISPVEIQEEDYRILLKNHKRKKLESSELPELDTQTITLQDILVRCQANKKVTKSPTPASCEPGHEVTTTSTPQSKKKQRVREKGDRKIKKKLKTEKGLETADVADVSLSLPSNSSTLDVHTALLTHRDDDGVPDFPLPDTLPSRLTMGQADSFFSLLRDVICDFTDSKATTAKLEERVREWQESPASALNSWVHQQENWVDCVVSALKFLSGDVLGLSMENFVPFLDYKERAQQWKWIGAGRDSNQHLAPLFYHWMKHKDAVCLDGLGAGQGSPPPVKMKTNFVVRPTTNAEKAAFREQEARRFESPHRAFTYQLHGYESVVGPVKGVYNKESAMTKAREHALLVSERPAYVTILTLVRDAAARLPNGEGTRGDICELLKDSHFLAPGVTDTQINTVVSGALDRLHSEKDPCVKYDVNSKLWIYLHRSRTEDEFERIHQAQGAAAKAKKSLQRPKASKAIKDQVASQTIVASAKTSMSEGCAASPASGDIKLKDITSLVSQPVRQLSNTLSETSFAQVRATKSGSKQGATAAAQKAAAAAIAAASTQAAAAAIAAASTQPANMISAGQMAMSASGSQVSTITISASPNNHRAVPQISKTQQAVAGTALPSAKSRLPTVTVSQTTGSSILGAKGQTVGVLQGQQTIPQNSSLLTSIGKPTAGGISKPPVVTVTKQGLASVSRQVNLAEVQPDGSAGSGNKGTAKGSPIILTQEVTSQTSSPAGVSLPSTAKVLTLAQSGSAGGGSGGATVGDGSVVTRLVQQQVVSVGSLLASGQARSLTQTLGQPRSTTLKIQGGSIVQPIVGGSPVQITGKPLATAKGLLQLGGKGGQPLGVIQTSHGQISTLSLIPQALATSTTAAGTVASGSKLTVSASSGTSSPVTFTMVGSSAAGSNTQSKPTVLTHVSTGSGTSAQAKVVSPSQAGMVVTQFTSGNSISLRPGLAGASQTKVVTGQAAGLVPAQFIVQQATSGGTAQTGAQGTPIIVSQASGKGGQQNIQVVRTVLSQQGGLKPGQATILISQPALQQAAAAGTVLSSAQVIHASGGASSVKSTGRGSPKGKTQPVYARIITPPAGMKLTTVNPNQVTASGNVNVLQTVGKILAGLPSAVGTGGGNTAQQNIGTVTISAAGALPSVAVAVTQAHPGSLQSLVRTQTADSGGSGTEPGTN